ncbi:MAG: MFS transporter [Bryobacteraceae bacterium]
MRPTNVHAAWWGTILVFLVHGLLVATWVSRIPAIKSALKLNDAGLGLTLLSSAVGAVCAIPFAGRFVSRYGSRKVTAISSMAFCFSLVLPGLAVNALGLASALFAFGATAASMDVSMNAQGVEVEKRLGKPTMSRFHGMFSLGGMIGAGVGGIVAARSIRPVIHFGVSALVYLLAIIVTAPLLLETHDGVQADERRVSLKRIPRALVALSAIGFCILLSEGAMADWTAVYLHQVLNAGSGTAAAGYSVFSAAMAIFRFLGDLITSRLGPARTVRIGGLVAACGMLWTLSVRSAAWAMPGFAAAGAGFSVIIPLVFGGGGRVQSISPGAGIATVTGIGYIGFIVGPPAIGFAAQVFTLRYALGLVIVCCIIASLLSGFIGQLQGSNETQIVREARA